MNNIKDKQKQLFTNEQLYQISSAAQNLNNTCMFEIGLSALAEGRNIQQSEGALIPHIKQMLKVLPVKMIFEIIVEMEKENKNV